MPTLRTSSTPWFCGYRRHTPFARYEPKYENKLDEPKRFTYEKRSSHADSSRRKCLKKNTEQFTASTSFNTFRSVFWHYGNHESDDCASGTCSQEATTFSRRTIARKWKKGGTSDWIRSTRCSSWSKKPYVAWISSSSSSKRKRKRVREKPDAVGATVTHNVSYRRTLHDREVQQEQITQHLEYQEAQLKKQLQTEDIMMASPEESFQENSESERQAAISAQQVASSLQRDMSQASSDCLSWKDGVWRLTKEVAEQSTKRTAGRAPRITHLFIHKHQEQIVRNPSRRQNKFIHHFSRCDPQKAIRGNMFCRPLLLSRTRDQLTLKVPQKGKKQRNSNLRNGRKRQEWNPFGNQFLRFFDARCRASRKALYFIASSRLPQAEWEVWSKAVKTCLKPIEYFKVWLEDWLVQNFELSTDFGFVTYQIHQAAVNMPHHPMKVTKSISIMELFVDRATGYANQRNQLHQTHPSAKKDRSTSPKGKGQGKKSEQEKVTLASVNIANHRPRTTSEKLLQFETSMNSHLKAERNLEQIRRSRNSHEMRYCVWKRTSVRKEKHQLLISEFGESKIQRHNSTSERDPNKWWKRKISKCTTDQSPQNQTSSEGMSLQRRRVPRQAWRYIPKKGCTSSTVALRYIWWDYLLGITEKRRLFDIQATNLDFQIANDIVVSDTHAKVYINELGASLWIHVVKDSPSVLSLGRPCN